MDDGHLRAGGPVVFNHLRQAVSRLLKCGTQGAATTAIAGEIAGAASRLARTAIDEAAASSGNEAQLQLANDEFDAAEIDWVKGEFESAVHGFGQAWLHAVASLGK